jgi:ABC-type nickel/cobalt efflux system permease component RcnA
VDFGVKLFFALLSSVVVDLSQPRFIIIIGSIISSLSLFILSFGTLEGAPSSSSLLYFIIFGVFLSFGQSLIFISAFAIIPYYFKNQVNQFLFLKNRTESNYILFLLLK